jgi:hypothetical protein
LSRVSQFKIAHIIFLSPSFFAGMRCLGIPNTAHFANVTQIEDAMALWEKLRGQKSEEAWKPEQVKPHHNFFNFCNSLEKATQIKTF